MSTHLRHLREPHYLYEKYQQIHAWGWTEARIVVFMNSYLVLGNPKSDKSKAEIDERSFQALIKFRNLLSDEQKAPDKTPLNGSRDLFTPTELIEMFPHVKYLDWTPTKLGIFRACGLLNGYSLGKGRGCMITRNSFVLAINHAVGTCERRVQLIIGAKFPKSQ